MPNPNGGFGTIFLISGNAFADMPRYDVDALGTYANEYIIYKDGRYEVHNLTALHSTYSPACIAVWDSLTRTTVGCFECSGAENSCGDYSECDAAEVVNIFPNERVRLDTETADIDVAFCAAPNTGVDYNGFCLSDTYPRDGVYSPRSNNTYTRGNLRIYYNNGDNGNLCLEKLENPSGTYCTSGYYMESGSCKRCPNGAASGVGTYHSYNYAQACWENDGKCRPTQYDASLYNYNLSEQTCMDCPSGAKCDGEYVYCPAGSYVYAGQNDQEATCVSCPDGGSVQNWYNDDLKHCFDGAITSEQLYGWTINKNTKCLWTDHTEYDDNSCVKLGGSDSTGTYVFQDNTGDYYECEYTN